MIADDPSTDTPSGFLGVRSRMHFTGRLDVRTSNLEWSLYLYMGRLIWASGGPHPIRRWRRYMTQHCPQITPQALVIRATDASQCQDYYALSILVKRQQITAEQAGALIRSTVAEVLFDVIQQEETKPVTFRCDPEDVLDTSLSLVNAEQILLETQQVWNEWCALGLADHSPSLAAVLRRPEQLQQHVPEKIYKTLVSLVDGKRTLRDISALTKQDLLPLMKILVPLFRKGLIGLVKVPDLAVSTINVPTSAAAASPPSGNEVPENAPLVACIDDSVRECAALEKIVTAAGYRFVGIQDSVQALTTLLEKKPGIIFLDLVMPIASGYEICSQLRRVSTFKGTPIIILTSNDGIIDRVRAKVVGSSGFLAKPVDEKRLLAVLRKYLPVKQ
jgi:two-component system, chemotaxis family, response regulator PixG